MKCLMEGCENWDGHSCPCATLDAEPRCPAPCCDACKGQGADLSGPCSDCYGTGHCHA